MPTTALRWTLTTPPKHWRIDWSSVRCIGSLYYLAYAFPHGFTSGCPTELVDLEFAVILLSIALHGVTAQPRCPGTASS